jgi:hypothetical protein
MQWRIRDRSTLDQWMDSIARNGHNQVLSRRDPHAASSKSKVTDTILWPLRPSRRSCGADPVPSQMVTAHSSMRPELSNNLGLKTRVGIAPPRPKLPRRTSGHGTTGTKQTGVTRHTAHDPCVEIVDLSTNDVST